MRRPWLSLEVQHGPMLPRAPLPRWRRWLAFAVVFKVAGGAAWLAVVFGGPDAFLWLWSAFALLVLLGAWRQAGDT